MNQPARARAFTLIELLVVIGIIALVVGITLPALGGARETSRRAKCLTNLKGLGMGLSVYMDTESKGLLPNVRPLHGGQLPGGGNDPGLLDVLQEYVDAPIPRKEEDGKFVVVDPYKCPSDLQSADEASGFEPVWRTSGTSYEYMPGAFMLFAELFGVDASKTAFAVTRAYEADRPWPILVDQDQWHKLRKTEEEARNAVFFGDWRADWMIPLGSQDLEKFLADVRKFGGLP